MPFHVGIDHVQYMVQHAHAWSPGHGLSWFKTRVDRASGQAPEHVILQYGDYEGWERIGKLLVTENNRSLQARYDDAESMLVDPGRFEFLNRPLENPNPIACLKAIACYRYQACEHTGWDESEAAQFCESLEKRAVGKLYETLPEDLRVWPVARYLDHASAGVSILAMMKGGTSR